MTQRVRGSSWYLVGALFLGPGLSACDQHPPASIDALLSEYSGPETPGAAVLIIRDGEFHRLFDLAHDMFIAKPLRLDNLAQALAEIPRQQARSGVSATSR